MKCPLIVFVLHVLLAWNPFLFCGKNEGDDEAVETQHFGKNEDQNHSDEEPNGGGERKRKQFIECTWYSKDRNRRVAGYFPGAGAEKSGSGFTLVVAPFLWHRNRRQRQWQIRRQDLTIRRRDQLPGARILSEEATNAADQNRSFRLSACYTVTMLYRAASGEAHLCKECSWSCPCRRQWWRRRRDRRWQWYPPWRLIEINVKNLISFGGAPRGGGQEQ